jgi:hypothetical protein
VNKKSCTKNGYAHHSLKKKKSNPSTWEAEAGRSQVEDQLGLYTELQAGLDYIVRLLSQQNKKCAFF